MNPIISNAEGRRAASQRAVLVANRVRRLVRGLSEAACLAVASEPQCPCCGSRCVECAESSGHQSRWPGC